MQTFLPYCSFVDSAKVLDRQRLGKQRVEARQILNALSCGGGWTNHPATRMWKGYEDALKLYMNIMIHEWVQRGYRNTMKIESVIVIPTMPYWLGTEEFHASHRSNLLRKDPKWYSQFGWTEMPDLPYVWPTKIQDQIKERKPE